MRKCVLFDFDGVLVDSEWRLFCQIREWLTKEYRITMPDSDCMRYIGGNDEATARDLIARYALPVGSAQRLISQALASGEAQAKTIRNAFKKASLPSRGLMSELGIEGIGEEKC